VTQQKAGGGGHILESSRKLVYSLKAKLGARHSLNVNVFLVPSQHASIHPSRHLLNIAVLLKRIAATQPKQHGEPVSVRDS
jgi:hypothetical protein